MGLGFSLEAQDRAFSSNFAYGDCCQGIKPKYIFFFLTATFSLVPDCADINFLEQNVLTKMVPTGGKKLVVEPW